MSLTAAELLKPRYEVIADFPDNHFGKVGTILDRNWSHSPNDDETQKPIWQISDFPHLFRKLNWWEYRKVEEMPKKVMSLVDDKGDTFDIQEWDMEMLVGWVDKKSRTCCSLLTFNPEYGYIPVD